MGELIKGKKRGYLSNDEFSTPEHNWEIKKEYYSQKKGIIQRERTLGECQEIVSEMINQIRKKIPHFTIFNKYRNDAKGDFPSVTFSSEPVSRTTIDCELIIELDVKNDNELKNFAEELGNLFLKVIPRDLFFTFTKIQEKRGQFFLSFPLKFNYEDIKRRKLLSKIKKQPLNTTNQTKAKFHIPDDIKKLYEEIGGVSNEIGFLFNKRDKINKAFNWKEFKDSDMKKHSDTIDRILEKIFLFRRYMDHILIPKAHIANTELFINQIIPYIRKYPGCLQSDLLKALPEKNHFNYPRQFTSDMLYKLAKANLIKREGGEKAFETYNLFIGDTEIAKIKELLKGDVKREKFHRVLKESKPYLIPISSYRGSKQMIIDYFGEKYINKYSSKGGRSRDRFLSSIGCCLRFDVNKPLKQIIDKYWTSECTDELRKYLKKYGFFSEVVFVRTRLKKIIGEEKREAFFNELQEKASTFKIKWRGFFWPTIMYYHIPYNYASFLKFKWGLKPKTKEKKCKYCGKLFSPECIEHIYCKSLPIVEKYYPIKESIKEINFCSNHFPPRYGVSDNYIRNKVRYNPDYKHALSKKKMSNLLKKLVDTIGFIPPSNFHDDFSYLQELSKEQFERAVKIINDMPPGKKISIYHPLGYQEIFGSWFQALIATGVLEEDARRMPFGTMCLAIDGHECMSLAEKNIDDWLYQHGIKHKKEPMYPGEGKFRGDWKSGKYFIEYWGMQGHEDYDDKIFLKREIAKEHNISLIEINPDDLNNLDEKFKVLLKLSKKSKFAFL